MNKPKKLSAIRIIARIAKHKKVEAFTLLELLIVLTIIGILMAIGMMGIPRLIDTANRVAVEGEMEAYQTAILNYKLDTGNPPASLNDLRDYVSDELVTDPWNVEYIVNYLDETGVVEVRSAGPDKTAYTDDDLVEEYIQL